MGYKYPEDYHILFEKMVDAMTDPEHFDRDYFIEILRDVCKMFDLSKGVTEFYDGVWAEKIGKGEQLVDYDDGRDGEVVMYRRYITPNSTVIKCSLYRPTDAEPLSEEALKHLNLMLRALMSFVSRNRLQTTVQKLANYDEFGYPNLNYILRYVEKLGTTVGLCGNTALMYNLRSFSLVNRDLGREYGDLVMRRYFEHIRDTIGDEGAICRVGGDNFACIFKNELLETILDIIRGCPVTYDDKHEKRVMISACAGVYRIPDDYVYERPGEIIGRIFPAAQEAKLEQHGKIIYTDGSESNETVNMKRVRSLFPEALKNDEFKAYYQPKVDISSGKVVGAEALCRWMRDGKPVLPMDFIPVLEQNTDICRLDFRILEIVCKDLRRLLDAGKRVVRVSVNLSRKHFLDVDLVDHLIKIIDEYRIPHEYIEFELTETTNDVGLRSLKRIVGELRERGIATAVDDFGMGYSSLNLIREIPWDVLKLDKDFLPGDEDDEHSVTSLMFRHVTSMANDIGLVCVTEGVETPRQIEILRTNNCNIAQGFYYDRPLPAEEFEERLESGYNMV